MLTTIDSWLQINQLRHDVLASRDCGRVTIEFSENFPVENLIEHANQVADGLAAVCHFRGLGQHWTRLSRDHAGIVLATCLHEDLIYHKPCMSRAVAQKLAGQILELFPPETVFLSNVGPDVELNKTGNWQSVTDSHVDAGVILVSEQRAGIVWVEDQK